MYSWAKSGTFTRSLSELSFELLQFRHECLHLCVLIYLLAAQTLAFELLLQNSDLIADGLDLRLDICTTIGSRRRRRNFRCHYWMSRYGRKNCSADIARF